VLDATLRGNSNADATGADRGVRGWRIRDRCGTSQAGGYAHTGAKVARLPRGRRL